LGVGAALAMQGEMTIGALIAVMALIWRVLGPLQTLFLSASTMSQGLRSLQQVNQLMHLQLEQQPEDTPSIDRPFSGGLVLDRVSFRYKQAGDPALMGVALGMEPNSCLAIAGTNGSGKSTMLKLMCRLYTPQAGAVLMDGLDLRQFDAREIRRAVSYLPQHVELFHGTIAQNLRLADPTAEDEDIARVLAEMGLQSWVDQLPRGTETVLNSSLRKSIPDGVRQRLGLARTLVRSAPIYLLDEPANNLDDEGDAILVRAIEKLRGKATVVMVTARPSHMRLADRVVYLDRGQILHDGPPEEVVPAILSAA
jgi:ABC-type bacteriocin/lantibiotic exporter with double-glycine peptidase domain